MYQVGYKRITKWWIAIGVIALLFVFLYFSGGLSYIVGFISRIFSPVQTGFYTAATAVGSGKSKRDLILENQELQKKIEQITLDSSQLKNLEIENQILREQLNFLEGQQYKYILSRVVSRSAASNLSAVIINRGKNNGVVEGSPVIAGEGILIGRIIEVEDNFSTVMLLNDDQVRVAATIQNQEQTLGVVEGEHGLSVKMEMIPRDENVKVGDTIITSGLQYRIPQGLLIGSVEKIDTTSSELFSRAYINPLVDYRQLNIVTVLVL
ncbi:MAG: rod shape-determining protein MreC [Patescibacteria group bacterium]|jgi:rod shape-determining protein MreC